MRFLSKPVILAALLMALIALRVPQIVISPRFWAEEGTIYFINALTLSPLHALIRPELGYISLLANLASLIATWLPLPAAALAPLTVSLLAQTGMMLVIHRATRATFHELGAPNPNIAAALVTALLMTATTLEVWLNTINLQFWAVTMSAALLAAPCRTPVTRPILVTFAALNGLGTLFLAPFFLLRALNLPRGIWPTAAHSRRADWATVAGLTFAGLVQIAVFLPSLAQSDRFLAPRPLKGLEVIFLKAPFVAANGSEFKIVGLITLLALIVVWRKRGLPRAITWRVIVPALLYGLLATFGSLGMRGAGRYAVPVEFALFVILAALAFVPMRAPFALRDSGWRAGFGRAWLPAGFLALHLIFGREAGWFIDPAWPSWRDAVATATSTSAATAQNTPITGQPIVPDRHWDVDLPASLLAGAVASGGDILPR